MNISNISSAYFDANAFEPAVKNEKRSGSGPGTKVSTERVELSERSLDLQKVRDSLDLDRDIRIPIVEEIKERIKNNDYPIENRFNDALVKMSKFRILLPY